MAKLPLEIDCQRVKQKLDAGENLLILDCREADEHAAANIPAAKLLPMSEIADRLGELDPHRAGYDHRALPHGRPQFACRRVAARPRLPAGSKPNRRHRRLVARNRSHSAALLTLKA